MFDAHSLSSDMREVRRLVEVYCSTQRHTSLAVLHVEGPLQQNNIGKPAELDQPGCYVIYGREGNCHYVGMSLSRIGTRIGVHLSPRTQQHPFWMREPAAYVDLIPVEQAWQAPSLEGYLIDKTATLTGAPPQEGRTTEF